MSSRKLTERQVRWSGTLSEFNFQLRFRARKKSQKPDALSRREQDMPNGEDDERLKNLISQLIKEDWISILTPPETPSLVQANLTRPAQVTTTATETRENPSLEGKELFDDAESQILWDRATLQDKEFLLLYKAVAKGDRHFPPKLPQQLKISISECSIDHRGVLFFRNRIWVPNWEPLTDSVDTENSRLSYHRSPGEGQHFSYPLKELLLVWGLSDGTPFLPKLRCMRKVPCMARTKEGVTLPSPHTRQVLL